MSENTTTPDPIPFPDHMKPPKKPWFKKPAALIAGFGLACAMVGGGIGAAGKPEPVTVTKEVPGPERIVTRTETVEKTPVACLTALDLSEQAIDYAGEALGYTKEAMMAASRLDAAGITAESNKVGALTPKIKAITGPLTAAKAECRAAE